MSDHLSDRDLERIEQFAETPAYEREPEHLLPDDAGEDSSDPAPEES